MSLFGRNVSGTSIHAQRTIAMPSAHDAAQTLRQTERVRAELAALRARDSVVLEPGDDIGVAIATIGKTGGVLILAEGTWDVNATIPVATAGIKLFGVTPERCVFRKTAVNANPLFSVTASRFELHGIGVIDAASTGGAVVSLGSGAQHFVMSNCRIASCYRAVHATTTRYGYVSSTVISGATAEAIRLDDSNYWTIGPNPYLAATAEVVYADDTSDWVVLVGNQALGTGVLSVKAGSNYQAAANAAVLTVRP